LFSQLAYHICRLDVGNNEELKSCQEMLKPVAKKFHRYTEFINDYE
jgi:hypothetical protein